MSSEKKSDPPPSLTNLTEESYYTVSKTGCLALNFMANSGLLVWYYYSRVGLHFLSMSHSHLSKDKSGCKQKYTQFLTLSSGTVFHALSHDVIRFARSVSPKKHFLTGRDSLTANQKLLLSWFSKLTLRAKWIPPCERA